MTDNTNQGWDAYQRLVLDKLDENRMWQRETDVRLQKLALDLALVQAQAISVKDLDGRLRVLENNQLTSDVIERYRKWLIGLAITVLVSVVIPIVRVYLG